MYSCTPRCRNAIGLIKNMLTYLFIKVYTNYGSKAPGTFRRDYINGVPQYRSRQGDIVPVNSLTNHTAKNTMQLGTCVEPFQEFL